jgi:hypothetical protein
MMAERDPDSDPPRDPVPPPGEAPAPPAEVKPGAGAAEQKPATAAAETRASTARPGHGRALPVSLGLLGAAAVGVGLYFAWPSISGTDAPVAPVPPREAALETPTVPRDEAPAPATEPAPAPPAAPASEAPGDAVPAPEAPDTPEPALEAPGPREPSADVLASAPSEPAPVEMPASPSEPAPVKASEMPAALTSAKAELAALKARLDAVERAAAEAPAAASAAPIDQEALAGLSERLAALEQRPAGEAAVASREAEFAARLAALEARLVVAEAEAAEAAVLRGQVAELTANGARLTERLGGLEQRAAQDIWLVGLVAAKAALVLTAREGAPLRHPLADLRAVLPDAEALAQPLAVLDGFAEHGAPTREALRLRFPEIARIAAHAAAQADEDAGWIDQTVSRLAAIVTVRKTGGELEPGSVDERLMRAERALEDEDLAGAREALDGLKGGEPLESFVADLGRRLALEEALGALDRHVGSQIVARITGTTAPAPAER